MCALEVPGRSLGWRGWALPTAQSMVTAQRRRDDLESAVG